MRSLPLLFLFIRFATVVSSSTVSLVEFLSINKLDLVWVLDCSCETDSFRNVIRVIDEVTNRIIMGPTETRQAFVEVAKTSGNLKKTKTIGEVLSFSEPASTSSNHFKNQLRILNCRSGITDLPFTLQFIQKQLFSQENLRADSQRIVIIFSDRLQPNSFHITSMDLISREAKVLMELTNAYMIIGQFNVKPAELPKDIADIIIPLTSETIANFLNYQLPVAFFERSTGGLNTIIMKRALSKSTCNPNPYNDTLISTHSFCPFYPFPPNNSNPSCGNGVSSLNPLGCVCLLGGICVQQIDCYSPSLRPCCPANDITCRNTFGASVQNCSALQLCLPSCCSEIGVATCRDLCQT